MNRPKIQIQYIATDWMIEIISILALLTVIIVPLALWNKIPETIPTHYDFSGQVDSFGSKWALVSLSATELILYVGITLLNRFPHIFNFPITVTEENAERIYRIGFRMVLWTKMIVCLMITYVACSTIISSVYHTCYFNSGILLGMLLMMGMVFIFAIIKMWKVR